MIIDCLTLRNFRNIEIGGLEPSPRLNFLIGQNGQGKTSFLEGISFLSTLRSFREAKPYEALAWGKRIGEVSAKVTLPSSSGNLTTTLKLEFERDSLHTEAKIPRVKKTAQINDKIYRNSSAYLSQRFGQIELGFHSIVFNPGDHDLVRGEPSVRRRYLDRVLVAESVEYLQTLTRYNRLLEQRNAVLKQGFDSPSGNPQEVLAGFSEPWVQAGAWLAQKRLDWLQRAQRVIETEVQRIAPQQPPLTLSYESSWAQNETPKNGSISNNFDSLGHSHFSGLPLLPSLEELEQYYWKQLNLLQKAEWRVGHSLVGPHRDDWMLSFGGQVLKGHGSQGEVRTALLALKLTELALFRQKTGHRPIFLLDDLSSELDQSRRGFLLSHLSDTDLQVFVTSTDESIHSGKVFRIKQGVSLEKARYDDGTHLDPVHSL